MNSDKLDMKTPDLMLGNIQRIAELFPHCVTETEEGHKIDFDLLRQELSDDVVEGAKERYRLEWAGKREAIVTANMPTTNTLRPVRKDSIDFDKTENVYIEGDNLEVLKLLQESYLGKIKMIYIDPPYNTGNDFIYRDNFTQANDEFLEAEGQVDELGNRLVPNPQSAGRYHSDWLSMMYPRLKLARNLLTDDGVIFISIDDNEVHNLRKMCDEIFGEGNFVGNIIWERAFAPKNDAKYFSDSHDHILVYAKTVNNFVIGKLERTEQANNRYTNLDNDPRGAWTSGDLTVKTYSAAYDYPITTPNGTIVNPSHGSCWRVSQERFQELVADNRIWFGQNGGNVPRLKRFLNDVQDRMTPITIWYNKDVGHNQEGRQELKKLFDNRGYFDGPKPLRLLQRILQIANTDKDSIILDFFSGSATTAHAVMQLNAEDNGHRKFIMVQLPEKTDEDSDAYKAGYHNICDIGKERIRRAAAKIKAEQNAPIDMGFRVYRLDNSNMLDVYYRPQELKQASLFDFADNIKADRSAEDLVVQIMLDWGLPLSLPIEQTVVAGKTVYAIDKNALYCCFEEGINELFVKEIIQISPRPLRIVFRDASFADDTAKENVKQLFRQLAKEIEVKVI